MKNNLIKIPFFALALLGVAAGEGIASPVTLTDGNSTAFFDSYVHPRNPDVTINGYWRDWTVDGTDNLFQSRISVRGFGSLVTMDVDSSEVSDTNSSGYNDTFSIQRSSDWLQVDSRFSLLGGTDGSGRSTINWMTDFINTSGEEQTLTLFHMVDFDLGSAADDEYGQMLNNNLARQWDDLTMVSMAMAQEVDHYYCGTPM